MLLVMWFGIVRGLGSMICGIGGCFFEFDIIYDGIGFVLLLLFVFVVVGFWFDLLGGFGNGL